MTVYRLSQALAFPPVDEAEPDGLLAVGGDLSPDRLLLAYASGIFPWQGSPPLWFSPDPRWVLVPSELRINRSLRRAARRPGYEVRLDTAFSQVIGACAGLERPGQDGTWLTPDMVQAYTRMHELGWAHAAECWVDGELAGGVYGLAIGCAFFGESMFSLRDDASKLALAALVLQLAEWGFTLLDCQVHTDHVERLGAMAWERERFRSAVAEAVRRESRCGPWAFDGDPLAALRD